MSEYDNNNKAHIEKAKDQEKDRERDLEWVLSSMRGRRWMYEQIFVTCHVEGGSHVPGCSDSTAFNEGARSIGQSLLQNVRFGHPKQYLKMLEENHFDG